MLLYIARGFEAGLCHNEWLWYSECFFSVLLVLLWWSKWFLACWCSSYDLLSVFVYVFYVVAYRSGHWHRFLLTVNGFSEVNATLSVIVYKLFYWHLFKVESPTERFHETWSISVSYSISFSISFDIHSCLFHDMINSKEETMIFHMQYMLPLKLRRLQQPVTSH